jgi:hypothetical protein
LSSGLYFYGVGRLSGKICDGTCLYIFSVDAQPIIRADLLEKPRRPLNSGVVGRHQNHPELPAMSMLCSLYRLTDAEAASVQAVPDAAGELLGYTPPPRKVSFLSKVFGQSRKDPPPSRKKLQPIGENETFDLGQAWHVLHYLFTGSTDGGKWPAAFIMSGGQEVGPDLGYGSPRLLTPEQSRDVAAFLSAQTFQSFDAAYIAQDIEAAQVYWKASTEPADRQRQLEELWGVAQDLQVFVGNLAQTRSPALVHIY